MAKVDVIIPFYNVPIPYLRTALESVFAQTYSDWRAVIVNDGSSEEDTGHLETFLDTFPHEKLIYVKTANQGLAAARNNGIHASDAPYIALLDSDDAWYPRKLESQVRLLDKKLEIVLAHGGVDLMDEQGITCREFSLSGFVHSVNPRDSLIKMLRNNFVACCTAIFRRESGAMVGFFDPTFKSLEDKALWVMLLMKGYQFYYQDEAMARYRVHSSNMSRNVENMMRARGILIKKVDSQMVKNQILNETDWKHLRKEMVAHMFREAFDGAIEQRNFLKALKYSYPFYHFHNLE